MHDAGEQQVLLLTCSNTAWQKHALLPTAWEHAMGHACLPMAAWYVLRGDWLWSGKGTILAQTPRIIAGWISQCVWSWVRSCAAVSRSA